MRFRRCCMLLAVVLCGAAFVSSAFAEDRNYFDFSMSLRQGVAHHFSNFPVDLRSVPIHPDDGWVEDMPAMHETLRDATVPLHRIDNMQFALHVLPAPYIGLGVNLSHVPDMEDYLRWDQYVEMNQYGTAERGYGMTLRYYAVSIDHRKDYWSLSGFLATPWQTIVGGSTGGMYARARAGTTYDLSGYRMSVESGWDRWDAHTAWQKRSLGKLYEDRHYLGLDVGFWFGDEPKESDKKNYFYLWTQFHMPTYRHVHGDLYSIVPSINTTPYWEFGLGLGR